MSLLLLFPSTGGGGGQTETLAAGDLTTAFKKWYPGEGWPTNETIRASLTTAYSISGGSDLTTVLSRFLKTRSAP